MDKPLTAASGSTREELLGYCRQRFAEVLTGAVGASGIRMPELLDVVERSAERAFDELAGLRSRAEFVKLRSLTASRISLVHPDDMDLTVALINLAHSLVDACESRLPRLHLLFMTLLDQDSSVVDQLPVGPDAVCAALRALCDSGELPVELRMNIPARVEKTLAGALEVLYSELTEALERAGVPPKSLLRSNGDSDQGVYRPANAVSAASNTVATQPPAALPPSGPLGRLQNSLMRRRNAFSGGNANALTDPSLLAAILERVTAWLTERQAEAAKLAHGIEAPRVNFSELSALLPPASNAALEAINLSFDAIEQDPSYCTAIKPSLARLRLPVCKAAMIDGDFLAQGDHPARQLLDVALRLALTLGEATTVQHPVCVAVEAAACRIQREFDKDVAVFGEAAMALEVVEVARNEQAAARAVPLIPLIEREARREQARSRSARAIRALCAAEPPEPVRVFLERLWVRVLANIHQRQGEKSPQWVAALATANRLIESVLPKADSEAIRQMAAYLPDLLAEIRAGLESIATPDILRERAFHSFVALHAAAMRGRLPELGERQDVLPPPMPPRVDTVAELPGLHVVRLSPDGEPERDTAEWIAQLKQGDWLLLSLPENNGSLARVERLRVGWAGGAPRLLLLSRPDDNLTVMLPVRWLAMRAAEQAAAPLALEALFERAAEAASRLP